MAKKALSLYLNSFGVKSVYLRTVSISSDGAAETRTVRACEGVGSSPVESVDLFFAFALGSRANASVAVLA